MTQDIEGVLINKIVVAAALIQQLKKVLFEMEEFVHELQEKEDA